MSRRRRRPLALARRLIVNGLTNIALIPVVLVVLVAGLLNPLPYGQRKARR